MTRMIRHIYRILKYTLISESMLSFLTVELSLPILSNFRRPSNSMICLKNE